MKEGREFNEAQSITTLSTIEYTLVEKMQEINEKIRNAEDSDELQKLSTILSSLLENLERIRKLGRRRS